MRKFVLMAALNLLMVPASAFAGTTTSSGFCNLCQAGAPIYSPPATITSPPSTITSRPPSTIVSPPSTIVSPPSTITSRPPTVTSRPPIGL
jgi:hypothetical protein